MGSRFANFDSGGDADLPEKIPEKSAETLSQVFLLSIDAAAISRISDGVYLDVNEGFRHITGYTREEVVGKSSMELGLWVDPGDRKAMIHAIREHEGFQELETQVRRKDGTVIQALMAGRIFKVGDEARLFSVARDITEQRRMEEALRASEKKYRQNEEQLRTLINAMPDIVCFKDGEGRWLEANDFDLELFQLKGVPFTGKKDSELAAYQGFYREAFLACEDSDEEAWRAGHMLRCEEVIPRPIGPPMVFDIIKVPLFHPDGSRKGLVVLGRDITERKQAERALRESEDRFHGLYEHTIDAIFWIRVEPGDVFVVEGINPAQEKFLGLRNEEVAGKRLEDFLPADVAETILANYQRCMRAGELIHYEESANLRGQVLIFQTLLVPIKDAEGRIYRIVGTSRDITAAKRAEEALRQAQKLESLGLLAGGIAHDFNNLLAAMLGNLNLAQLRSAPESPAHPYLENVEKTLLRAAELTKQMLAYSGKGRFVVIPHDLNKVVWEMTHLLDVSIPKKVSLHYELAPSLPLIEADVAQIQQVVLNLVTNAAEAIGEREGAIRVVTRQESLGAERLALDFQGQVLQPGSYVVLEVSDTGCGMGPEVIAKIFDPFFTTKRSGRGLGLSAMLGILRGHGAGIRIISESGRGSAFTLYFPAKAGVTLTESGPVQTSREGGCSGRILLVDDEAIVRNSTAQMLECLGFKVVEAFDGMDAVAIFEKEMNELDLVLMDLSMPRMDGREALAKLRDLQPDMPVILCSGFNEGEAVGSLLAGFVQKPFSFEDLKRAIRLALDSR